MAFLVSYWTVFHAARHDYQLTFVNPRALLTCCIAVFHFEPTADNHKQFVLIFVKMPRKWTLKLHELHVLAVKFANDSRVPVIVNKRQLLVQIDRVHLSESSG